MKYTVFSIVVLYSALNASTCPIIFVHGQHGAHGAFPYFINEAKPEFGWRDWNGEKTEPPWLYRSAMNKILDVHYRGYTAGYLTNGDSLECDENSSPASTGDETRKVYNFSFYHPYGDAGVIALSEESVLVYISHGLIGDIYVKTIFNQPPSWGYDFSEYWPRYMPRVGNGFVKAPDGQYYECLYIFPNTYNYVNSWKTGKYAKRLADFIDKVRTATGASKVDLVCHSIGGLVARAAIKYYGCDSKVRKLLTVGTMNQGWHGIGDFYYWQRWFLGHSDWQIYGEDLEMNVDPVVQDVEVNFTDLTTENAGLFVDYLTQPSQSKVSTIAGTRGTWTPEPGADDGLVLVADAPLSWADFNAEVYASHGWGNANNTEEICLLGCTYTEEFIKNWMIDDNVSHNSAQLTGAGDVFLWPLSWDSFEVRLHASVDDYNKALVLQSVICDLYSGEELMAKAFPIYTYQKSTIDEPFGDPVLSTSNLNFDTGFYRCKNFIYDMDHAVATHEANFEIKNLGLPARVEVLEPSYGDIYTVQGAWDKLTIQFKANFQWANLNIYFSPHEAGPLTPVWTVSNYKGDGETKTIQFAMPQVNSTFCRIFVKAKLDNFTEKECVSEYFTIRLKAPDNLYCFAVDESKVGLDWQNGSLTGYEVQRRLKNTSTWVVVGHDYWGPGSKSFYDTDVIRDTVYYYRVCSYGVFQGQTYYSDFCSPISVTTPKLNAPYHELRVHSPASNRINVQYLDKSEYETSFEIWRKSPVNNEVWHIVHEPGPAIGYHGMTIM